MGNCCESVPHNRQVNDDDNWEDYGSNSVYVNVYDLNDSMITCNWVTSNLIQLGGAFHAGVEVYQCEWSYGTEGIFKVCPKNHEYHVFNQAVPMGKTHLAPGEVQQILRDMAPLWKAMSYDLVRKNCCTFADDFCRRLGVGPLPGWVNRLAEVGAGALLTVQQISASLAPAGISSEDDKYKLLDGSPDSQKCNERQSPEPSSTNSPEASYTNESPSSVASSHESPMVVDQRAASPCQTPVKYQVEDVQIVVLC